MIKTPTPPNAKTEHADALQVGGATGTNSRTKNKQIVILAVAVSSLIISILMLEFCLAVAGVGEEEYLKRDPEIGWVMMPKKHITWRHEGYSIAQVNSAGMLDREFPLEKSKDTLRIAVVGDSYVEALQVSREQNFCKLLEDSLGKNAVARGKNVEVLNFGISAYNIAQIYLRLKNLAVKYHPDIVIVTESVDATRYLSPEGGGFFRARPNFTLGQDKELICNYDKQNAWLQSPEGLRVRSTAWLRENSHIWGVAAKAAEQATMYMDEIKRGHAKFGATVTDKKTTFETAKGPACVNGVFIQPEATSSPRMPSVFLPRYQEALVKWWPVHRKLLFEMKEECKAIGAEMVLVRLPQVNAYDNVTETKLLKRFATRNGVSFIDATKTFQLYKDKTAPLFYDPHMSEHGHRLIANQLNEELAPVIRKKLDEKAVLPSISK
ncbi:MAG TPA: SGNH/GDSL hydrolase family protein [Candidatus Melainabacteria bacterium]|nr:SGNH/GDSL hydrolase family protein [Candidatus Melainabacteria bacterium]HIN66406.1 SGNH/GDSL hydrolase family protein [Candidatus Obscuribacterales bacterium]